MAKYRIEPAHSELFVEARSNVHPIEIRTQGLLGMIDLDVDGRHLDLSTAPPKILRLEMQPERAKIHAARLT